MITRFAARYAARHGHIDAGRESRIQEIGVEAQMGNVFCFTTASRMPCIATTVPRCRISACRSC